MPLFGRRRSRDVAYDYGYLLDLAVLDVGLEVLRTTDSTARGEALDARLERMHRQWPFVRRRPRRAGCEVQGLPRPAELDEWTRGHLVVDSAFAEPFEVAALALSAEERRAGLRALAVGLGFESLFADRVLQVAAHATRAVQPEPVQARRRAVLRVTAAARAALGKTPDPLGPGETRELVRALVRAVLVSSELCGDARACDALRQTLAERRGAAQERLQRLRETECPPAEIRAAEATERELAGAIDWLVRQG